MKVLRAKSIPQKGIVFEEVKLGEGFLTYLKSDYSNITSYLMNINKEGSIERGRKDFLCHFDEDLIDNPHAVFIARPFPRFDSLPVFRVVTDKEHDICLLGVNTTKGNKYSEKCDVIGTFNEFREALGNVHGLESIKSLPSISLPEEKMLVNVFMSKISLNRPGEFLIWDGLDPETSAELAFMLKYPKRFVFNTTSWKQAPREIVQNGGILTPEILEYYKNFKENSDNSTYVSRCKEVLRKYPFSLNGHKITLAIYYILAGLDDYDINRVVNDIKFEYSRAIPNSPLVIGNMIELFVGHTRYNQNNNSYYHNMNKEEITRVLEECALTENDLVVEAFRDNNDSWSIKLIEGLIKESKVENFISFQVARKDATSNEDEIG